MSYRKRIAFAMHLQNPSLGIYKVAHLKIHRNYGQHASILSSSQKSCILNSMRAIIRHFIYTASAMYLLQSFAEPFDYGESPTKTFLIVALAITLIVYFTRPLLKIISFPVGGLVYTALLILVIGAGFYALQSLIPEFAVKSFYLPGINLFGIMLGDTQLEGFKALGFVSAFMAVFIGLVGWVMG